MGQADIVALLVIFLLGAAVKGEIYVKLLFTEEFKQDIEQSINYKINQNFNISYVSKGNISDVTSHNHIM